MGKIFLTVHWCKLCTYKTMMLNFKTLKKMLGTVMYGRQDVEKDVLKDMSVQLSSFLVTFITRAQAEGVSWHWTATRRCKSKRLEGIHDQFNCTGSGNTTWSGHFGTVTSTTQIVTVNNCGGLAWFLIVALQSSSVCTCRPFLPVGRQWFSLRDEVQCLDGSFRVIRIRGWVGGGH